MESSPMLCKQGVTGSIPVTSTDLFNDLCAHSVFSSSALQSKIVGGQTFKVRPTG